MVLKNENIHVIPDTLSDDVAVFTEPLAAAFEILEQVDIKSGTPVAIIGDGRLALCIANVLKLPLTLRHLRQALNLNKGYYEYN